MNHHTCPPAAGARHTVSDSVTPTRTWDGTCELRPRSGGPDSGVRTTCTALRTTPGDTRPTRTVYKKREPGQKTLLYLWEL